MANDHYQDQNLYYIMSLLIVFILLIQNSILAIAQPNQYISADRSNSRSTLMLTTTIFTTLNNNNDDAAYDNEVETNVENIYDDEEEDFNINSPPRTASHLRFNNSITPYLNEDAHMNEYEDEISSDQDDYDDNKNPIFPDTMSINRATSKYPMIDSNNKKPFDSPSTSRMPFISSHIFRNLFAKPTILVGIVGGIVIGMLSAILLVMFIVYRMRKKDEGSYALEEGPRKSPSHAYSRVSSKEFFA